MKSARIPVLGAIALALALVGCSQPTGEISQDAVSFDGISPDASIRLSGTEPFWGLSIEPVGDGYEARYITPDNIDGSVFPVARFAGNNGLGFSGELNGAQMQVTVTPGDCSDGMSDRTYPYVATIALGDDLLEGCGHTSDEPFSGDEMP